jgi:Adenylate cyclase regulatory domain
MEERNLVAAAAEQPAPDMTSGAGTENLLAGLAGQARRDRAELIAWLRGRGFTVDQIGASLTPMMLPANRVMGDDGVYISTREMARQSSSPKTSPSRRCGSSRPLATP